MAQIDQLQFIRLKVTIKLLSPLHVGGEPGEDTNISYILRDAEKWAFYPGTAFKGKLRHYALQLRQEECLFLRHQLQGTLTPKSTPCGCTVCRLFGGEGNARGSLIFSDFRDIRQQENHDVRQQEKDFRMGNQIDRFRRVADDAKLFTTESAVIKKLVGYITGNAKAEDIAYIRQSAALITQIGGNTSRGYGWIDGEIEITAEEDSSTAPPEGNAEKQSEINGGTVQHVQIKVTPKSPLLIGKHTTQSNFRDTQPIIPGAVLRAALARAICERDGTSDATIEGIKGKDIPDGKSLFPNLRQAFADLRFSVFNSNLQPEPFPITARKFKADEEHELVDVLSELIYVQHETQDFSERQKCLTCKAELEKVQPYEDFKNVTVTSTHSAMDPLRGTSRDGYLYAVRAIAPDTVTFSGTISGKLDIGELNTLLSEPIQIGAMTTAGFGQCEVAFEAVNAPAAKRSEKTAVLQAWEGKSGCYIPITLMSDAIVDFEEPSDGDYLKAYEKLVVPLKLVRVIAKSHVWRGFDTGEKEKFEKKPRFILQAGSVFVVRADALDDKTREALSNIEQAGIGSETGDGYGAVCVSHKWHFDNALFQWKEDE